MTTWKKRWWPGGPPPEVREDHLREFLEGISFTHSAFGPNKRNPEHGIEVDVSSGVASIVQWDLTEPPDDEDYRGSWEEYPVLKTSTVAELRKLLDPEGKHRGSYVRDTGLEVSALPFVDPPKVKDAIINAALSYISYWGGTEEYVSEVGD